MNKLKIAVIGVGHLGKEHARIYSQLPNVELVGVIDRDSVRAGEIASLYKTFAYTDVDSIIQKVDAASIVVPTDQHFEVTKKLISAGKHVLVEKPITSTLKEAKTLVSLAEKKRILLQVGHIERFNPIIQAVSKFVKNPRFIEIHRLSPFTPRGTEVSVVLDLMIHDIDIILALVKDKIKNIEAIGVNVLTKHEDIANARIAFKNGCVANLTASRVSAERMRKIRIFQANSYTSVDYYKQEGVSYYKEGQEILRKFIEVGKDEPLKLELQDFVECVLKGKRPKVSGDDAFLALQVAEKIKNKIKAVA
jgi:predicted dehydrogenase